MMIDSDLSLEAEPYHESATARDGATHPTRLGTRCLGLTPFLILKPSAGRKVNDSSNNLQPAKAGTPYDGRRWGAARWLMLALMGIASLLLGSGCDHSAGSVHPSLTNMVLIQAGSFVRQKHRVTLTHDFWLGKYEVTQGEYAALMGNNPSHFRDGGTNRPVEKVSYGQALQYCAALNEREQAGGRVPAGYAYRLPTEAEWEYACRAGTTNLYSFGDDPAKADRYAWTQENSGGTTHTVGEKLPNPWGLYDMHGNVWEWTVDWFGPYPAADVQDPTGPAEGKMRVFRGGGWNNEVPLARSANRFAMSPERGIYFVGFRVALAPRRQP